MKLFIPKPLRPQQTIVSQPILSSSPAVNYVFEPFPNITYEDYFRFYQSQEILNYFFPEIKQEQQESTQVKIEQSEEQEIHQCQICNKILTTEKILNYHVKDVHSKKDVKCPNCPYTTTSELRLSRHSCRQSGPSCPDCGKRAIDMNKHFYNVHKIQTCKDCKQEFIGYNKMREHQQEEHQTKSRKSVAAKKKIRKFK